MKGKDNLPNQLTSRNENLSGYNMSDVKVHYNSSKPSELGNDPKTQDFQNTIHISTPQEKHLPHEAWHVVQQKRIKRNRWFSGLYSYIRRKFRG